MESVQEAPIPRKRGQTYPGTIHIRGVLVQENLVNTGAAPELVALAVRALLTPRLKPQPLPTQAAD